MSIGNKVSGWHPIWLEPGRLPLQIWVDSLDRTSVSRVVFVLETRPTI